MAHRGRGMTLVGDVEEYFEDFVHYTNAGIEKLSQNYADFFIADGGCLQVVSESSKAKVFT